MLRRPKDSWRTKNLPLNSPLRLSWNPCDEACDNGRSQRGFTLNSDWSIVNFGRALKFKCTNQSWEWNHVASGRCSMPHHKGLRKAEEVNFKANFSFFTSLSAAEAHVFGVKFIGLYETVIFIAIRNFSCWGENDLWSDVWLGMYWVVYLSILLEGGVTVLK